MTPEVPPPDHDALQPGTRLGEFEIQRVLGVGGFGIVYLAFDHALERLVALKEYMPSALASRGQGQSVSIRSTSHVDTFGVGLRSFVNEAKLLARFDHPSLVKVYRFWEDNGTAYMVMPYYQGQTLREVRRGLHVAPDEGWLRGLLDPLLGALEVLHNEQVYHRDIAPDNILLLASGQPVLLDFGAARRVIGDRTQTLTAILKPNFAPIEQYAETAGLRQGPWTDLYALGAVMHYCLTGKPPTPAAARAVHDEMPSVRSLAATLGTEARLQYGEAFVSAIDACLTVRPQGRPDSVAALRALLRGERSVAAQVVAPQVAPVSDAFAPTQPYVPTEADAAARARAYVPTQQHQPERPAPAVMQASAAPPASGAHSLMSGGAEPVTAWAPAPGPARVESAVPAPAPRSSRRPLALALGIVPIVFAALLWYVTSKPRGAAEAVAMPASAPVAGPVVAAASDVQLTSTAASAPSSASPVPALGTAAAPAPAVQSGSAVAAPATTTSAAQQITAASAPPFPKPRLQRHVDPLPQRQIVAAAPTPVPPVPTYGPQLRRPDDSAAVVAAAPRLPPTGPMGPREACGGRVFLALYNCMKRECTKPEFARNPQCIRINKQEDANQRAYQP